MGRARPRARATDGDGLALLGEFLARDVPVTHLLFLEKQLTDVHTFVAKLPLLDPAEDWADEPDPVSGTWKTHPAKTVRSKKVPRNHRVAEATQQHPEQVQVYTGSQTASAQSSGLGQPLRNGRITQANAQLLAQSPVGQPAGLAHER